MKSGNKLPQVVSFILLVVGILLLIWKSLSTLSCGLVLVWVLLFSFYVKRKHNYWDGLNVPNPPSQFLVGHTLERLGITRPFMQFFDDVYYNKNGKYACGIYEFLTPALFVGNPQLIKIILEIKFNHFSDRRIMQLEKVNPVAHNMLTNASGENWRQIRTVVSPTFTQSRVKNLNPLIYEHVQSLVSHLKICSEQPTVKIRPICGKYTMDTIASCAFGIQCDSFKSDEPIFPTFAARLFKMTPVRAMKVITLLTAPRLAEFVQKIGVDFVSEEFHFFIDAISHTIKVREESGIIKGDFVDIMRENKDFSMTNMTAQSILFLLAGYENTSTTISVALHLLAINLNEQRRLRRHLVNAKSKSEDEITSEMIIECEYLDAIVKETLRLYPPGPVIERTCTKDFTLSSNPNITIRKGESVTIPVWSIHRDPEYWPNPDMFIPSRFLDSNKHLIRPCTYIPFGMGPRSCVGFRFAIVSIKLAIANIVLNFSILPSPDTIDPPPLDPKILTLKPASDLPLRLEYIKDVSKTNIDELYD